jgi:DNA modification methylase
MHSLFNKSSELMHEVANASVDLIFTSPPYNIATPYGKDSNNDKLDLPLYQTLIKNVFSECVRILTDGGRLIIEAADTITTNGKYLELAGFIQSYCIDLGLQLEERHINFVNSIDGKELPEHHWGNDYIAEKDTHSNCCQILVLSKSEDAAFVGEGEILYINCGSTNKHPCPTPVRLVDFVLDNYFKPGMTVADPFMGTAEIGKKIVTQDGNFIGYELNTRIFNETKTEFDNLLQKLRLARKTQP